MAFKISYTLTVEYMQPGIGLGMNSINQPQAFGATQGPAISFFNTTQPGTATFTASDVTTLLTGMTTDLSAQMNANLTRIANFGSGGN
jgi:hypothetical protein